MNLSEKLWHLMDKQGIKRSDLSKQTGLPYTTIDSILRRKDFDKVKLSTLHSLKKYFGVSLDYLIIDEIEDENYGHRDITQAKNIDYDTNKYQPSDESLEVAEAYDMADLKSKNSARYALDLPMLVTERNPIKKTSSASDESNLPQSERVKQAEDEYIKSVSERLQKEALSASNTTENKEDKAV